MMWRAKPGPCISGTCLPKMFLEQKVQAEQHQHCSSDYLWTVMYQAVLLKCAFAGVLFLDIMTNTNSAACCTHQAAGHTINCIVLGRVTLGACWCASSKGSLLH